MTLQGPNGLSETVTTGANGVAQFGSQLVDEGNYTITETPKPGWDQVDSSGCSFTLNLPADGGKEFTCTIKNVQRGHIIVKKVTQPAGSSQSFTFNPSYGSSFSLTDGGSNDSGALV